ncbi:hypothetical protein HanIR_Chr11g0517631 [Helianthus annuus]|nr:hypothetical protein HanIR_Chr11g0517631 [Helianthus annuus]
MNQHQWLVLCSDNCPPHQRVLGQNNREVADLMERWWLVPAAGSGLDNFCWFWRGWCCLLSEEITGPGQSRWWQSWSAYEVSNK